MLRYQTETPAAEPVVQATPAQEVPKATYEAMFRHQHGMAEPTSASVDNRLVAAATVVLDRRTEEASKSKADALLENIQSQGIAAPFAAESALVQSPAEPVLPAKSQASKSEAIDDLEF